MLGFALKSELLTGGYDARVTTVNCVGVMGKGNALAFKQKWPDLFTAYEKRCRLRLLRPGHVWLYRKQMIFCMATKDHWRQPSSLEWVAQGLAALESTSALLKLKRVVLPLPGCGNGGLSPICVKRLLREHLDNSQTFFMVCDKED